MKKIITICALLVITINLSAQKRVAGYMGKRLSIGYSNYFSPRFNLGIVKELASVFNPDVMEVSSAKKINSIHCLDLDYIISERKSLCVSGQFTKLDICEPGTEFGDYHDGNKSGQLYYQPADLSYLQAKSMHISVGIKVFKSRYLNPYGKYRKFEFILVNNTVQVDPSAFAWTTNYIVKDKPDLNIDDKFKLKAFVFAYTIGKQRVFYDKLILDWGVRLGLESNKIFKRLLLYQESDYVYGESVNDVIKRQMKLLSKAAVLESQFINIHLGLRFLAF